MKNKKADESLLKIISTYDKRVNELDKLNKELKEKIKELEKKN